MIQTLEQKSIVRIEDQKYRVSLPGYCEVLITVQSRPPAVCHSCHRALDALDERMACGASVCFRCYPA